MKSAFMFAAVGSASAQTWKEFSYCDYDQFVVEEIIVTDPTFDATQCYNWCLEVDAGVASDYNAGDNMCCDFERWVDGSFNCYLYAGGKTVDQDMNDYPDDVFSSLVFPHLNAAATAEEETSATSILASTMVLAATVAATI